MCEVAVAAAAQKLLAHTRPKPLLSSTDTLKKETRAKRKPNRSKKKLSISSSSNATRGSDQRAITTTPVRHRRGQCMWRETETETRKKKG